MTLTAPLRPDEQDLCVQVRDRMLKLMSMCEGTLRGKDPERAKQMHRHASALLHVVRGVLVEDVVLETKRADARRQGVAS